MRVRILSGNMAGQVVEQTRAEAENNIVAGFAEAVKDEPVPATAKPPKAEPVEAPVANTVAAAPVEPPTETAPIAKTAPVEVPVVTEKQKPKPAVAPPTVPAKAPAVPAKAPAAPTTAGKPKTKPKGR